MICNTFAVFLFCKCHVWCSVFVCMNCIFGRASSYYKSSSVCLFVCLSVCSLSPPRSFDRSSPNLVGVCRWTSELPLRGSFSKRSTARRVNGSLSLSTILYMCQPHSTQLQKATLLLLHLIRLERHLLLHWRLVGVCRWISELIARRVINGL